MKKRLLSLLLCLSFVLGLVPTAALATDEETANSLTPADKYYTLSGETSSGEKPDITLHKTAVDNGDGTYTVTLTAEAKEQVNIKETEVAFVLDASGSMNWCTENLKKGQDGNYYDPNNRGHVHGWRGDVPYCSLMGKKIDGVTVTSRWDQATAAIHTVEQNLPESVEKHYVYFSSDAKEAKDSSYTGVSPVGSTQLSDGVKKGIAQLTDTTKKRVLIIVADGDSDDGYPADEVKKFKEAGGVVYTVGFTFSNKNFEALASDGGSYNANNADELKVAMDSITTKVAGLISDTMGEGVELVENSAKWSGDSYKAEEAKLWTSGDGKTLYWTSAEGLSDKVTLTYTVKLTDATKEAAKENGLDVPLNKSATLNYDGANGAIQVPFPVPVAHVDRELKKYTLTYVTNKGSEIAPETYTEGTKVNLTKKTTTLDGYTFKGWYSDEALTTKVDEVTMDKDQTVYAKWDQIYYKLNYEANGGTAVESKSVAANGETDVDGKTTKDGYKFLGWYSDKELTKPISKIEKMTGDVTVYAKWQEITYTLTYVSNGGTEFNAETYPEGKEVALDKIPTKSGFTFTGWFADAALTQLLTKVTMNANKTVYAGWKEDETPILEKGDHSAYIIGYKDGTVQPDRNISRAEVATIFFRLLTDEAREKYWSSTNEYTDVQDSDWCNNAISTLSNMGILKGYKDGTFKPTMPVTRAEFAAIAARFNDGAADEYATFSDVANDYWASKEIAKAAKLGWIKGYTDGTFRPEKEITRGEVMILVNRVLERGVDKEGLGEYAKEWKDVQPGNVFYYDVQEATNSHEYARTDKPIDGQSYCYEEWTKLKENRDWAALEKIWKNEYEAN